VLADLTEFWKKTRSEVRQICGQEHGRRERSKVELRGELARECGVSSQTIKGFLNGYQKTLPHPALVKLFSRIPGLEAQYNRATGLSNGTALSRSEGTEQNREYVQMTLHFDGFDNAPEPVRARIPQGREGFVTVKIGLSRVG
jgi:hypothetical protein